MLRLICVLHGSERKDLGARWNLEDEVRKQKTSGDDLRPEVQFGTDCQLGRPLSFVHGSREGTKELQFGRRYCACCSPCTAFVVFVSKSFLLLPYSMEIRHPRLPADNTDMNCTDRASFSIGARQ
ncbi:hypothetical protein M413DRAFT_166960 [Hebeloma cylindrosporum]|uniref:Uncharacterized protein n=1 Tax=Hebeloma cylindrosporum TaxID=76867 RepID=A0A0C2XSQ7_HEBCY|nr:hypothetical protein M413DRAFT_166960 [Hebeloma cylindrosporum h7]